MPQSIKKISKKSKHSVLFLTLFGNKMSGTVQDVPQTLQTTGDAVVVIGTVAGRPKAIGYAAPGLPGRRA